MQDSKFWRIIAVTTIAAVLYVGHGLHHSGSDGLPRLGNVAHAGGVGVATVRGSVLYTSSEDGKTLYMWNTGDAGRPTYAATAMAKEKK
jgi:hypothetical protein